MEPKSKIPESSLPDSEWNDKTFIEDSPDLYHALNTRYGKIGRMSQFMLNNSNSELGKEYPQMINDLAHELVDLLKYLPKESLQRVPDVGMVSQEEMFRFAEWSHLSDFKCLGGYWKELIGIDDQFGDTKYTTDQIHDIYTQEQLNKK